MVSSSSATTRSTSSSSPSSSSSIIEWWALVFSRSRMVMFGFTFGFLVRGPFVVLTQHDTTLSSSSRLMTSMRDPSFEAPPVVLLRKGRKLITPERQELQELSLGASDRRPTTQQQQHVPPQAEIPLEEASTTAQPDYSVTMNETSHNVEKQLEATHDTTPSLIVVQLDTGHAVTLEKEIIDFEKQDKVVIAIKIHGVAYLVQLKQSLCLLTAAYNNRLNYDILLFHSEPLPEEDVKELQSIVHPARLLMELDEKTLKQHLEGLDQEQTARLLKRCNVNETSQLEWWTRCSEENHIGADMPLRYNWQAEFRSKWIWYNKQLAKYRYMMWWDSDAMATKVWHQDPVAFLIRNKLKMFFDNFPAGRSNGRMLKEKMIQAYNQTLCSVRLVNGRLHPIFGDDCENPSINHIHGFFHVTDLDFYRNEENLNWFNIMIGNAKFSRKWDDQLAVTVPAAMRAANESWHMNHHGVKLDVFHNQLFDGQRRWRGGGYQKWYQNRSAIDFPESIDKCKSLVRNSG